VICIPSRFAFFEDAETVKQRYSIKDVGIDFYEYYNIKPTNRVIGIVKHDQLQLVKLRWGFVKGNKFFKARGDTIDEKKLFAKAFRERRCLILANGFFEWKKEGGNSIPYYFKRKDDQMFTIAGIYNSYEDEEDGETKYQFAVITTEANEEVGKIFHRMPVILEPEDELRWLDLDEEPEALKVLFEPYPANLMISYEVESLPSRGDNGPQTVMPKSDITSALDDFF
jgi:putative SOS response-associated peptidase YedK